MSEAPERGMIAFIERVGRHIPDPVLLFISFWLLAFAGSVALGGLTFSYQGADGQPVNLAIRNMADSDNIRWLFDNALLTNWLGFGGGVLGVILVVMLGVGLADQSGLFTALLKKAGRAVPVNLLPLLLVFLGVVSNLASDAGYLVLIPLAGVLYAGLGKNPLIGMAAAFAGVSAGFSANLIPATSSDVIVGMNAKVFAESQGIPFVNGMGEALTPATMNYYFLLASAFVLGGIGAWVTHRFVQPRLERKPFQLPTELQIGDFDLSAGERQGLRAAGIALVLALAVVAALANGPLAPYVNEQGQRVVPYLNNVILLIAFVFGSVGAAFGWAAGRYNRPMDLVRAMVKQMETMGYILVLTFFCYNFLGLLNYSGLGSYVTYLGAQGLTALGLEQSPILLLVGFVLTAAVINLFVGGMTSKWMLLGPIFIPMLYLVNPQMTPDLVSAAFRVGDSATNVITPMMSYAGIVLAFMRRYQPEMTIGEMIALMMPYSIAFLGAWMFLLITFFTLEIPLGF